MHTANRNVFNDRLKLFPSMTGSRKLSGREFQTNRPATEKARRPSVLSRYRGTTGSCPVADRSCCRDATSPTGWHNSTRYGGAWPCRQLNVVTPSLYTTRSETSSRCRSVWRSRDKPRSNLCVRLTTVWFSGLQSRNKCSKNQMGATG